MENTLTVIDQQFYKPIQNDFEKLMGEKAFRREIGFAIQILKKSDYLQKCTAESVLESVYNISQTGLTLNPVLKYAYLIPRKVGGKLTCILEPGYQGLIKLATDTDNIVSIDVQLAYEGDDIDIDLASDKKVTKHIPYVATGKEKGKILYGYSIATLQDGSRHVELMSAEQVKEVRKHSESYKNYESKKKSGQWASSPWVSDAPEMFRKTIVKRHFKYLPKSDNRQLEKAIELDNRDYDFPASFEQGNMIESLMMGAAIPEQREREIHQSLYNGGFTQREANECIEYLQDNQADPVASGNYYNQGAIKSKLSHES